MREEEGFISAIKANPGDALSRSAYADWLEERGDFRGGFVRLHWALAATAPDHPERVAGEQELSRLRKGCATDWLAVIEPPPPASDDAYERPKCGCFEAGYKNRKWPTLYLHAEAQDTECEAWMRLLDLVEVAAADGRDEFSPLEKMSQGDRSRIITLPPTIAKLKAVKKLNLYGSHLVRIPPEIGEMTSIEEFDPYTSYRLHWFPFEITRCPRLRRSRVSTRALYGNHKYRPPFPRLHTGADTSPGRTEPDRLPLGRGKGTLDRACSVCGRLFEDRRLHRVWISLGVATDVLPLLVNACSAECINQLPAPPDGHVSKTHKGGLRVQQPPRW